MTAETPGCGMNSEARKRAAGAVTSAATCEEGIYVTDGQFEPCDRAAVALRRDPEERTPYPVCRRHVRGDMVPLLDVPANLSVQRGAERSPTLGEADRETLRDTLNMSNSHELHGNICRIVERILARHIAAARGTDA